MCMKVVTDVCFFCFFISSFKGSKGDVGFPGPQGPPGVGVAGPQVGFIRVYTLAYVIDIFL